MSRHQMINRTRIIGQELDNEKEIGESDMKRIMRNRLMIWHQMTNRTRVIGQEMDNEKDDVAGNQ